MNLQNNLALLLVLLISLLSGGSSRFRIFKGEDSNIEDRPYMVSLHSTMKYFCAGSLVNMETVITAAHCLRLEKEEWVKVRAGGTNSYGGESRNVKRFIRPDDFNETTRHMDIAAIKLCSPFTKSPAIKAIPLCKTKLKNGDEMRVSAWGVRCEDSTEPSVFLQTTVLNIGSKKDCASKYKNVITLTSSMICGHGAGVTCRGDGGAPGVVNGRICTVVSTGMNCGDSRSPGIFTNLNDKKVLKFVQKSMKAKLKGAVSNRC